MLTELSKNFYCSSNHARPVCRHDVEWSLENEWFGPLTVSMGRVKRWPQGKSSTSTPDKEEKRQRSRAVITASAAFLPREQSALGVDTLGQSTLSVQNLNLHDPTSQYSGLLYQRSPAEGVQSVVRLYIKLPRPGSCLDLLRKTSAFASKADGAISNLPLQCSLTVRTSEKYLVKDSGSADYVPR